MTVRGVWSEEEQEEGGCNGDCIWIRYIKSSRVEGRVKGMERVGTMKMYRSQKGVEAVWCMIWHQILCTYNNNRSTHNTRSTR